MIMKTKTTPCGYILRLQPWHWIGLCLASSLFGRCPCPVFTFLLGRLLGGVGPPLVATFFGYNLGIGLGYVLTLCAALTLASTLLLRGLAATG